MTPNKRDLKAYVRYDGSGRVVPGSLILRRKMPKVGKWTEVQGYQCCNQAQQTIVVDVSPFPLTAPDFVIESNDASPYMYIFNYAGSSIVVNTLEELLAFNQSRYSMFGSFSISNGDLLFTPNATTAAIFAANGTVDLAAYSFSD